MIKVAGEEHIQLGHGGRVVVADGEKALFLINAGTPHELKLEVAGTKGMDNPPTSEQGSDKPGGFDNAGIGRSAVDDTDWHQLEKDRFVEGLAEVLRKQSLEDRFSELVIVAPQKPLARFASSSTRKPGIVWLPISTRI